MLRIALGRREWDGKPLPYSCAKLVYALGCLKHSSNLCGSRPCCSSSSGSTILKSDRAVFIFCSSRVCQHDPPLFSTLSAHLWLFSTMAKRLMKVGFESDSITPIDSAHWVSWTSHSCVCTGTRQVGVWHPRLCGGNWQREYECVENYTSRPLRFSLQGRTVCSPIGLSGSVSVQTAHDEVCNEGVPSLCDADDWGNLPQHYYLGSDADGSHMHWGCLLVVGRSAGRPSRGWWHCATAIYQS